MWVPGFDLVGKELLMRRTLVAALIAMSLAGGVMACGGESRTSTPTTPEALPTPVVVAPTLSTVIVEGIAPTIGASSQFTATANYSDNTTRAVTGLAAWQSSSLFVAIVSVNGLVTAVGAGNTEIRAMYLGVTGAKLVSLTAVPNPSPGPSPPPTPSPTPPPPPSPTPGLTCNGASVPSVVDCLNNQGFRPPTAKCNDGAYSCSQNRSGTCSTHGGVACYVCPGPLC
jgi:hypothetical protein